MLILIVLGLNFNFVSLQEGFKLFLIAKTVLLIGLFYVSLKVVLRIYERRKSLLLLPIVSVIICLTILELVFTFIPRSHHAEESYASIVWQNYYYNTNKQGFRDENLKHEDKPALVFMGDSYTAGYGIKEESQRFSNLVGEAINSNYEFYNFGMKGTGLKTHLTLLEKSTKQNNVLVYQILINDLDDYCARLMPLYNIYSVFTSKDYMVAKSSFLLNYLYFNLPNKKIEKEYFSFFNSCYEEEAVFEEYKEELLYFIKTAKEIYGFKDVIIMIVPTLTNIELSQNFDSSVTDFLKENSDAIVLYPKTELERLNSQERIINMHDSHPSVKVNKILANEILQILSLNEKE